MRLGAIDIVCLTDRETRGALVLLAGNPDPVVTEALIDAVRRILERAPIVGLEKVDDVAGHRRGRIPRQPRQERLREAEAAGLKRQPPWKRKRGLKWRGCRQELGKCSRAAPKDIYAVLRTLPRL